MQRTGRSFLAAAICALACAHTACADDPSEPTVTPYRPTVSNPADLPQPGWLEGEFGAARAFGADGSRNDAVPWLVKYAFDADHGVLIGGNAYLRDAPDGAPASGGIGDLALEWKQRFPIVENAAFGIEAGAIVPTAAHDLGVGRPAWLGNGIFSIDLGGTHLDLNAGATRYATRTRGVSRWQGSWAAAGSWPLTSDFGAALELSGTQQHGAHTQSQLLGAINYNSSAHLVLDAGLARGLTHAAHDTTVFAGATLLLGKLK